MAVLDTRLPYGAPLRSKPFWITCLVILLPFHFLIHGWEVWSQHTRERIRDHPALATAKVYRKNIFQGKHSTYYEVHMKFKPKEVHYTAYPWFITSKEEWASFYVGEDVAVKYDPKDPDHAFLASDPVVVEDANSGSAIGAELYFLAFIFCTILVFWAAAVALARQNKAATAVQP